MCAIITWKGTMTPVVLKAAMRMAERYGPHSTGLAYIHDGMPVTWKRAVPAHFAIHNHNRRFNEAAKSQTGIGHTRFATHGRVTDENAHPFVTPDIIFAHNGIITNYHHIMPGAVVDSQCLEILIRQRDISSARGSVGLCWLEKIDGQWELFAYRHNQNLVAARVCLPAEDGSIADTVMVVSRESTIPQNLIYEHEIFSLDENTAYQITAEGPVPAWKNPITTELYERNTYCGSRYTGG